MKKMIGLLLAMVLVMGILAGCSKKNANENADASQPSETGISTDATAIVVPGNNIGKESGVAAITDDGYELSTALVNYYYVDYVKNTYQNIMNYYGESYFSYIGLDIYTPLNTQYYQQPQTWAAYFLELALEKAAEDRLLYDLATRENFQLPEEKVQSVLGIIQSVENYAAMAAYASPDAYLEAVYGAGATFESYKLYVELTTVADAYYYAYADAIVLTEEELTQYGEEYFSDYSDTQYVANVRHLLVAFEGGVTDSMGGTYYSEEEKATAKGEAEMLLFAWQSGAATEDSFISMVQEFTDDPGSKETGGFYGDIHTESPYVEAFLNWSVDPARKAGDTGIVETEYGYHIMYFSGYGTMTHRDFLADEQLRQEKLEEWYVGLVENIVVTTVNTQNLMLDMVMAG